MKKFFLLLHVFFVVALMSMSCNEDKKVSSVCRVQVKSDYPSYHGTLISPDGSLLDSLAFIDGVAQVVRTDSVSMPYVAFVHLVNSENPTEVMDMPLVIEGGNVSVEIGEYIMTAGTPMNVLLQDFLNELQTLSDGMKDKNGLTLDDLRSAYSSFYRAQIISNKSNVVGKYILEHYGVNLSTDDKKAVEAVMNN